MNAFKSEFIVQRYIKNPLLLANKKFDLRIYIVIKGMDPVEGYLYDEGMARFCTHDYEEPDDENLKNHYMHLTNFNLNKD